MVYQSLQEGLDSNGSYSFYIANRPNNLRVYRVGVTLRVFEITKEDYYPMTAKGRGFNPRTVAHPTGKEDRLIVTNVEPSQSKGYLKVTLHREPTTKA